MTPFSLTIVFLELACICSFLLILIIIPGGPYGKQPKEWPFISVLIAARNEEKNIIRCLNAISRLVYPEDKIEILVGDDDSDDQTARLVTRFIEEHPEVKLQLIDIKKSNGQAKGKANVLAQLARRAEGKFLLFTDADIAVPSTWAKAMVQQFRPKDGIVTGITVMRNLSFFSRMQSVDWVFAMGIVKVFSRIHVPVTSMGNNMAIRREAYEQTGGFENIPFSVTEDFSIFKEIIKNGWRDHLVWDNKVLAVSEPIPDFGSLLVQRKRWMKGALQLPFIVKMVLLLQAVYYPAIIYLFFIAPWFMLFLAGLKTVFQTYFISRRLQHINRNDLVGMVPLYELYALVWSLVLLLYFMIPTGIRWKGRKY